MMNALALGLVLTSLVTAGFFTPNPENPNAKEDVIVKEGHRVVVVEFEKDDGNTKVSISPQDSHEKGYVANAKEKLSEKMEDMKEKMKEAVLPEDGKVENAVHAGEEEIQRSKFSARELVCDAYGKCKHKLASAMGKTKDAVVETAHEAAEKVHEAEEAVGEAIWRVKDTVAHGGHMASDKALETVKDAASDVSGRAKEKADEMRERAGEVSGKAKDKVAEMKEKAKERVYDVIDGSKRVKEGVEREASERMEGTKGKIKEKVEEAGEMVGSASDKVKEEGKRGLGAMLRRARGLAGGVMGYMVSPLRLSPVMSVFHLMGFAAAYGMCVWVTFASSYVLAGALPRHQFAMVQSKIYPVYFKAMAYGISFALLGHFMRQGKMAASFGGGMFQGLNLLASLGMVLANLVYLEPRATKVMFERMKKEKEEGRGKESHPTEPSGGVVDSSTTEAAGRGTTATAGGASTTAGATQEKPEAAATATATAAKSQIFQLSEMLKRLNSYSSFLNILTLMSLTWHLVHLGQCLQAVC